MRFFLLILLGTFAALAAAAPSEEPCRRAEVALAASEATRSSVATLRALAQKGYLNAEDLADFAAHDGKSNPTDFASSGTPAELFGWRVAYTRHAADPAFDGETVRSEARALAGKSRDEDDRRAAASTGTARAVAIVPEGALAHDLYVLGNFRATAFPVGDSHHMLFQNGSSITRPGALPVVEVDLKTGRQIPHAMLNIDQPPSVFRTRAGETLVYFSDARVYHGTADGLQPLHPERMRLGEKVAPVIHEGADGKLSFVYDGLTYETRKRGMFDHYHALTGQRVAWLPLAFTAGAREESVTLPEPAQAITPVAGSSYLAVVTEKSFLVVDMATKQIHWRVPLENGITERGVGHAPVVLSGPHGPRIAYRTKETLFIVDPADRTEVARIAVPATEASRPMLAVSDERGEQILIPQPGRVDVVDVASATLGTPLVNGGTNQILPSAIRVPGQTLVYWTDGDTLRVANLARRKVLSEGPVEDGATIFAFEKDGDVFAVAYRGTSPQLFRLTAGGR